MTENSKDQIQEGYSKPSNILCIKVLILKKQKKTITRLHPIDIADPDIYQALL